MFYTKIFLFKKKIFGSGGSGSIRGHDLVVPRLVVLSTYAATTRHPHGVHTVGMVGHHRHRRRHAHAAAAAAAAAVL